MNGLSLASLVTDGWAAVFVLVARGLRLPGGRSWWRLSMALVVLVGLAGALAVRNWPAAEVCAATLILLTRDWWNRRGRRAAKELGAKSRARIEGLVGRTREVLQPSPQRVPA